jgi:hypothetical protein
MNTAGEWWKKFAGHAAYRKSVGFDAAIIVRGESVQTPGVIADPQCPHGRRRTTTTDDRGAA